MFKHNPYAIALTHDNLKEYLRSEITKTKKELAKYSGFNCFGYNEEERVDEANLRGNLVALGDLAWAFDFVDEFNLTI